MRNFVRMFQPRFAALVESGVKLQTIRSVPKRMPKPGDTISLRAWMGRPRWSKQRVLRTADISYVASVQITHDAILINGQAENPETQARFDGFRDWNEMRDWFEATHGLPFSGILLRWI